MLPDRFHPRHFLPFLILFTACTGLVDNFTHGRSLDPCSSTEFPVCDSFAGCILDNTNYLQGHFPGKELVLVRTTGPASVELHFLFQNITASGGTALFTWYEPGCNVQFQQSVPGDIFVGEAQKTGEFMRAQDLLAAGDHQITYQSSANGDYYFKVVIVPK